MKYMLHGLIITITIGLQGLLALLFFFFPIILLVKFNNPVYLWFYIIHFLFITYFIGKEYNSWEM